MSSQFVVVYYPDSTVTVEVVGPFRSEERAQTVADRLAEAMEPGSPDDPQPYPHVQPLLSAARTLREWDA